VLSNQQKAAGNLAHAQLLTDRDAEHFENAESVFKGIPAIHPEIDSKELGQMDEKVETQDPRTTSIDGVLGLVDAKIKVEGKRAEVTRAISHLHGRVTS